MSCSVLVLSIPICELLRNFKDNAVHLYFPSISNSILKFIRKGNPLITFYPGTAGDGWWCKYNGEDWNVFDYVRIMKFRPAEPGWFDV